MAETKPPVPSSVDLPKGTNSAWGNGNKKNRGNSGKTGSGNSNNSNSDATTVDKQFRNDSQDLGVMYQRYFDCSSPHDQVRFTLTQERLSIFAGEKYQPFGKDFKAAIMDPAHKPTVPAVAMPTKIVTNEDGSTSVVNKTEGDLEYLDKLMLKEQVSLQVKKETQLTGLKQTLFNFIYGRCTELLQDRIKSHKSYDALTRSSDPFDLLTTIREIVHQIESNSYVPLLLDDQLAAIYRLRQGNKTVSQYHTAFKSMIAALDTQGGSFGQHPAIRKAAAADLLAKGEISSEHYNSLDADEKSLLADTAREMYLAIRFLQGSDHQRFLPLLIDLKNNFAKGTNQFPQTVQKAVDLLLNWEKTHPVRTQGNGNRQQQQQLTLESDNVASMQWFVDASYGVHPDMRSHTGAVMTMGKGAVISGSNKQKLNTKSSTEAELVGVDDYMAKILSVRYFTEDQGYPVGTTTVHQDNQSTILLEKNGPASSSKRTRHINIRYFFVTDRVNKKEIKIEYCPTKEMVADFFTKPLQGCLFYKLRALILNMDA